MNWELIITFFGIVLGSNVTVELFKWLFKRDTPERKMLKALGGDALYKWLCEWKHEDGGTAARSWRLHTTVFTQRRLTRYQAASARRTSRA